MVADSLFKFRCIPPRQRIKDPGVTPGRVPHRGGIAEFHPVLRVEHQYENLPEDLNDTVSPDFLQCQMKFKVESIGLGRTSGALRQPVVDCPQPFQSGRSYQTDQLCRLPCFKQQTCRLEFIETATDRLELKIQRPTDVDTGRFPEKGSPFRTALKNPEQTQMNHNLTDRAAGYAESLGQFHFAGQPISGNEFFRDQVIPEFLQQIELIHDETTSSGYCLKITDDLFNK